MIRQSRSEMEIRSRWINRKGQVYWIIGSVWGWREALQGWQFWWIDCQVNSNMEVHCLGILRVGALEHFYNLEMNF